MQAYLDLMRHVLEHGARKDDRTGTGTLSVFGHQLRCDLSAGFPLLTTKKLHLRSIVYQLLWFLRGETNVAYLREHGVTIWDEWADAAGELGPVYGYQWRSWPAPDGRHVDQIAELVAQIARNPDSRRHIVSAGTSPTCRRWRWRHAMRSSSSMSPAGVCRARCINGAPTSSSACRSTSPRDALLTLMTAQVTQLQPGDLVWTGGDCHLYLNHLEQAREQLTRTPRPQPSMRLNPDVHDIFGFA